VRHSPSFWRRMSQFNEEIVPEILSTHPANETRAKELEELLPTVYFEILHLENSFIMNSQ
jgi:hypothetical protein